MRDIIFNNRCKNLSQICDLFLLFLNHNLGSILMVADPVIILQIIFLVDCLNYHYTDDEHCVLLIFGQEQSFVINSKIKCDSVNMYVGTGVFHSCRVLRSRINHLLCKKWHFMKFGVRDPRPLQVFLGQLNGSNANNV